MREREIVWDAKHKESGKENTEKIRHILTHTRERERQTQRIKNVHRAEISHNEPKSSHQGCNPA